MTPEPFVDSVVAGNFLGLAPRTMNEMARRGVIPAYPFGTGVRKIWRFRLSELDQWMKTTVQSASHPPLPSRRRT
jgi:excisionase family DNA binding protein